MTTTTVTDETVRSSLLRDFAVAGVELGKARRRQSEKDTPAHRDAVVAVRDWIDAVLDMYLAAHGRRVSDC